MTAPELISFLGLSPLPEEGGYFRETWRSSVTVAPGTLPLRYTTDKALGTAIYYLLTSDPDSFSALHRLPTDEIYHFYLGDPVEMLLLAPDGSGHRIMLGHNLAAGEHVQFVVPAGVWQGSRLVAGGQYALLGTTMSPGFDPTDYQPGLRAELMTLYPHHAPSIQALTR
jgi:predicted cupin superfamily sugar epimerase